MRVVLLNFTSHVVRDDKGFDYRRLLEADVPGRRVLERRLPSLGLKGLAHLFKTDLLAHVVTEEDQGGSGQRLAV